MSITPFQTTSPAGDAGAMPQLEIWSPSRAKKILRSRLQYAKEARQKLEARWDLNERCAYATRGMDRYGLDGPGEAASPANGSPDAEVAAAISINYAFKNLRFLHSQLSANPPVVIPRPATSDPEDRRRARAADAVVRFALRQYGLQEVFDQASLSTLLRGTGIIKVWWDSSAGAVLGFDDDGRVLMEGAIRARPVSPWNLFVDPDADSWDEVRWVIEEVSIPYDEALRRWPSRREALRKARAAVSNTEGEVGPGGIVVSPTVRTSEGRTAKRESIKVYEYWETGLATNALLGRHAVHLADGTVLEDPDESPHSFVPALTEDELRRVRRGDVALDEIERGAPVARLPYHFFTDVDVPEQPWGKAFMEYEAPLQDYLNRLDTVMLENLQAHGVARLILPDECELAPGSVTNSPLDLYRIKTKGSTREPHFMAPMAMPSSMSEFRAQVRGGIDDMAGVNESMFGQQSRETAGFAMQYATNQGNVIRRRLFVKLMLCVEGVYRTILDLARKHWDEETTLKVLGKEKSFEIVDLRTADIDGGYDLVVEYGTSLSLDPMQRRDEIMKMLPLLEKAGVPERKILSMLRLGEVDDAADDEQMAEDRQREIFDRMIATATYIPPQPCMDHEGMLAYAMRFMMSKDFDLLEPAEQMMVRRHYYERGEVAAKEKAGLLWQLLGLPQPPAVQSQQGQTTASPPPGPMAAASTATAPPAGAPNPTATPPAAAPTPAESAPNGAA